MLEERMMTWHFQILKSKVVHCYFNADKKDFLRLCLKSTVKGLHFLRHLQGLFFFECEGFFENQLLCPLSFGK